MATAQSIRPWWTTKQVAEYYQLPVQTVLRKIRRGEIRAKNFGTPNCRRYRVSAAEIRLIDQTA